ncbi:MULTISPECIES: Rid family detoxifying hydrolase [Sphingobacterium]|uniref:Rid family detoxifying hydrolase n=1 Tax=Sphingobacterium TaxID=28453 RepID=UPI00257D3AA6|nr:MULTISPECIES: Rid family detoxifying hydrolase [Sphingobacterium]
MHRLVILSLALILLSCGTKKEIIAIKHNRLPEAIGPYNHSTRYGNLIFVSGQIGFDPKTNALKNGVEEQTVQILENLKMILEDNQSDLKHVTKTTIFLKDLNHFETVNAIYSKFFNGRFPARSTIEVTSLPRGADIEIECTAVKR